MKPLIHVVVVAVGFGTEQFRNAIRRSYRLNQLVQNTLNTLLSKFNLRSTTSLTGVPRRLGLRSLQVGNGSVPCSNEFCYYVVRSAFTLWKLFTS